MPTIPAPGARVVIRDAEWVVRRVDLIAGNDYQLTCDGVSELVRDQSAVYLSALERIEVLDPAGTRLKPDRSAGFADSLLHMESQLREAVPNDERIHIGHQAAMDLVPYQLDPGRQALSRPRQRILIADAVGLGKTLEAGVLVSELIARGRGRRILVLAVKSMLTQFQKEFWSRFTIPLTRLDSIGIQRVRSRIPTNHNPFHYYDKSIISIDTLKQDAEYRTYLENAWWDIIVIDEAHNVADRGTGSLRSRLARLLSRRSDTLIMLSATPHDGKARSFASLMNMLDATAIADPDDYAKEDFRSKGLVIRRFKKDIQHQVQASFRDRKTHRSTFRASAVEETAFDALLAVQVAETQPTAADRGVAVNRGLAADQTPTAGQATPTDGTQAPSRRDLFAVTLEKALFSSPAACIATIDQRIRRRQRELEGQPDQARPEAGQPLRRSRGDVSVQEGVAGRLRRSQRQPVRDNLGGDSEHPIAVELRSLQSLREALVNITAQDFAKYRALLAAIREGQPFRWRPSDPKDRLVIFTERIETLRWLEENLRRDLNLRQEQLAMLHGGLSDVEQQRLVEDFGNAAKPVRLLLCSDVAAEGINLHYRCHRLIHFDMPWSLMVFSQRNGRVDRYGQEQTPEIVYLVTRTANAAVAGDLRVLEVLERKDEQAYRNIGDPSAFMNVHDVQAEEAVTSKAIANGEGAERFDARLAPQANEGDDLLALFLGTASAVPERPQDLGNPPPPLSLFADDLAYCKAALHRLRDRDSSLRFEADADRRTLTLDAPEDLRLRFRHLPPEVAPEHWRFVLTSDPARMRDAISASRREEAAWPKVHYLWCLNPVVGWLNDRMAAAFGRHEAPVLAGLPGLAADEAVFVLSGLVPNRKGHPLLNEWIGVAYRGERFAELVPFPELLQRIGMGQRPFANRGLPVDAEVLRSLLPDTVAKAKEWFVQQRNAFEDKINTKLNIELEALEALKDRRLKLMELRLERSSLAEPLKQGRAERERREIDDLFSDYLTWIEDTMTTEPQPWVKVVCAMVGTAGA